MNSIHMCNPCQQQYGVVDDYTDPHKCPHCGGYDTHLIGYNKHPSPQSLPEFIPVKRQEEVSKFFEWLLRF